MALTKERIYYLLTAYISKKATTEEESELMDWVLEAEEDSELKSYVLDIWNQYEPGEDFSDVDWDEIYSRAVQAPVVPINPKIRRIRWYRFAAAAIIFIVLSAGAYFYFTPSLHQSIATLQPKQNDVAPPTNKAVLILSDGTKIELDSTGSGTVAVQGNVQITKKSTGEINYAGTAGGAVTYNTLDVPRGSRPMSLMLSDGSKVWINVGSSLTYPTAFFGNERKVKITGEAYFEVVHNEKMPFIVEKGDLIIKDLGTHFNVNTYEDEPSEKVTLLEGSVRITRNSLSQLLKPGQQVRINNRNIQVSNGVDIEEVMAWKDGKFMFDKNTDIGTIMRQISRWYNVEIEYQGNIDQRFWGSISKDVNVSQVLKILEATGGVKFKVEGNKIFVMPASR